MKLKLKRIAKQDLYTIGNLYIDDVKFCDTLEDTDRGISSTMSLKDINSKKLYGITAIPTGIYEITLNVVSPKFSKYPQYNFCNGKLPRLINVPGYEGVLIHIGNHPKDTAGCILVGKNKAKGAVLESTETFKQLYIRMQKAIENNEKITIEIL